MVTISHVVQDILNKHVFLQEAVNHGIVSYNKLAVDIKPEIEQELGKKIKTNAIVMALRRYSDKLEKKQKKPVFDYFRETLLKTDICYIVVEESATSLNRMQGLYNEIDFKRGGIFNIIQGNYEVGIITNQRSKEKLLSLLSEEKILNVVDNLVGISLTYTKDFMFAPGVLYNVLRFLAWENINIVGIIMTQKELSLIVSRDDAMKCYNTLERLGKSSKNSDKLQINDD
jgi:aspartokinase